MVKNGQPSGHTPASDPAIEPVPFANPDHPGLGMEVLTLKQLRALVPPHHRRQHSRPEFHQLMLITSGVTEHEIDFARHRCGPGSVLHLRPGQVQRFVRDTGTRGWVLLFRTDFVPPEPLLEVRLGPSDAPAIALRGPQLDAITHLMQALASA